jgi:hypothetical protein
MDVDVNHRGGTYVLLFVSTALRVIEFYFPDAHPFFFFFFLLTRFAYLLLMKCSCQWALSYDNGKTWVVSSVPHSRSNLD